VFEDLCRELEIFLNGPDSEIMGGNTYFFGCTILEEVEGARGSDDSSVAERCGIN
jgi:hypothetical protein